MCAFSCRFKTIVLCFTLLLIEIDANGEIVETTHGKVEGKKFTTLLNNITYHGFMSIPYAEPPVKDLRFLPPVAAKSWSGVLQANKEKMPCIQKNFRIIKGHPYGFYGVEDCLYLDIFTPFMDTNKRAVIVFLYNENFVTSYNKTKDYGPDFFIEEDIVVVTISHRLSVFGFLSFEDEVLSGNSGLNDIVLALEWTRNNIERFGGDPTRITVMGAWGGAVAVDLLVHSAKAKELFSSAILQSDSSWSTTYLHENVRQRAFTLAKLLDITSIRSERVLKELNKVDPKDLLEKEMFALPEDYFKEHQRYLLAFGPIVERQKGLVTEYPENSFHKINIPIMIGFNSREGLEPSLQYLEEPRYLSFVEKDYPLLMPKRVNFQFDPAYESYYEAVKDIKNFYFKNGTVTIRNIAEYITYIGDISAYAMDSTVRAYSNKTLSPIFYYNFDYCSSLNEIKNNILQHSTVTDGTWGAARGDELCYLFKCPTLKDEYLKHNQSMSEEIIFLRKLVKMWGNFAKYGNPTAKEDNPLDNLEWPKYNIDSKEYLYIGQEIEVKQDIYKERFAFWDEFLKKWEGKDASGINRNSRNKRDEL